MNAFIAYITKAIVSWIGAALTKVGKRGLRYLKIDRKVDAETSATNKITAEIYALEEKIEKGKLTGEDVSPYENKIKELEERLKDAGRKSSNNTF